MAGGLDTFVTSEYNYSQYLKEISLDTLSGGEKGEKAYKQYTADQSCGKFMNTLFLLTLRKATALETFHWNIRVELSRPVFRALHNCERLRNLHVRLHKDASIYETPPPLKSLSDANVDSYGGLSAPVALPSFNGSSNPLLSISGSNPPPPHPSVQLAHTLQQIKAKDKKPEEAPKQPPTFSKFKGLNSLAVLDMDTLEYVTEIRECLQNSSASLNELKLSFNEALALQARKPPPVVDPEDSEEDPDDFGAAPTPAAQASSDWDTGPAKIYKAKEERKVQEGILAKILGVDTESPKTLSPAAASQDDNEEEKDDSAGRGFIKGLKSLSEKLMTAVNGPGSRTQHQREALEIIEKAARTYVDAYNKQKEAKKLEIKALEGAKAGESSKAGEGSSKAAETSSSSSAEAATDNKENVPAEKEGEQGEADTSKGLFSESKKDSKKTFKAPDPSNPDDFDVEAPDPEVEVDESPEMDSYDTPSENQASTDETKAPEKQDSSGETKVTTDTATTPLKTAKSSGPSSSSTEAQMYEYLHKTRGFHVQSLALYLIPIKASVLSRAFDLSVLQSIVLLNVGPQTAFWSLIAKENSLSGPLPLRKIHTDHVTLGFLNAVKGLECVEELYLLERNNKAKSSVESWAPKTTVGMEDIRSSVLKRHMKTLRVLMVKNEVDWSWDANDKAVRTICRGGRNLEELAFSLSSRTSVSCFIPPSTMCITNSEPQHTLLQHLSGLSALRALHIIEYPRTDDHCPTIRLETRRFIIDVISYNPEMKLEYLALRNDLERLVRRRRNPFANKKKLDKGKGKEKEMSPAQAVLHAMGGEHGAEEKKGESSDDEGDSEGEGAGPGVKLESLEGVKFYDVYGVDIFKKDVMTGRL